MSLNGVDEKVLNVLRADPQHYKEVREALPSIESANVISSSLLRLQEAKLITIASNGMIQRIDGEGRARATVTATFEFDLQEWAEEYGLSPEEVIEDVNEFLVSHVSEPHRLLKIVGSRAQ